MVDLTRRNLWCLAAGVVLAGPAWNLACATKHHLRLTGAYQVLATRDLGASQNFYERHFGMHAVFVADWYVQLIHPQRKLLQLGLIVAGHPSMPTADQQPNGSAIVTLQVDDVDAIFRSLREAGVQLLGEPRDEPWGQRHFFAIDPGGFFVDVVMPITPAAEYADAYVR